jgi:hypothetical protein
MIVVEDAFKILERVIVSLFTPVPHEFHNLWDRIVEGRPVLYVCCDVVSAEHAKSEGDVTA